MLFLAEYTILFAIIQKRIITSKEHSFRAFNINIVYIWGILQFWDLSLPQGFGFLILVFDKTVKNRFIRLLLQQPAA